MLTVKWGISNMDWMVAWVENRHAPDFVVAIHGTMGWWTTSGRFVPIPEELFTRVLGEGKTIQ
jgi:hypothetical protein